MIFTINGCDIDTGAYEVRRGGTVVPVEPQVFDLLVLLLENRDRLVTKDEILEHIWKGRTVSEAALSSRVKAARKAIGDDGAAQNCIRTVHRRGFRIVADVEVDGDKPPAAQDVKDAPAGAGEGVASPGALKPPEDRTSLVVLPFRFIGDAAGHEHMMEGLHDELTSALARVRSFFVIARGTAQALAARDMDVREIAETLGVRYVVEGTLRLAGESLRVNAKLTDAVAREEVWSAPFSGDLNNSFDVLDEIIEALAGVLQPTILVAEVRRLQRRRPENLTAYSLVFQAMPLCWAADHTACTAAAALLDQAIALDPNYALAHALRSWCHAQMGTFHWTQEPETHRKAALATAQHAAALDDGDPLVLTMLATAECLAHDMASAAAHVGRALKIDPNFAWGWIRCGLINTYLGRGDVALADFNRVFRLSPLDPLIYLAHVGLAQLHIYEGRYQEAVASAEQVLLEKPKAVWANRSLAAAAAMAGHDAKAARCVALLERYAPGVSVDDIMDAVPVHAETMRAKYRDALLRAGFRP
jgi:TolB-like protein